MQLSLEDGDAEYNAVGAQHHVGRQEGDKVFEVVFPHAVVHPAAVMVEAAHATVADATVLRPRRPRALACRAFLR